MTSAGGAAGDSADPGRRYERAPCGLATIRHDGGIVAANATLREMIGEAAWNGTSRFHDLLRIGDRIFWETHVGPLLEMQGHVREIAVELSTDDGPLPVLLNARTERPGDPSSTIDVAVFPAKDRRSYESELLAARKQAEVSEAHARRLAMTLQQSLIPPSVPAIPGLELGAAYRPAGTGADVGGDFYDFFRVTRSEWCIVVGDVCGKGPAAATVAALARYTIRGAAMESNDIAEGLQTLNSTLLLDGNGDMCTALVARISRAAGRHTVKMAAAGHPVPLLVDEAGTVAPAGRHGVLLGAFEDADHRSDRLELRGGTLVMFTDGVVEARRGEEFFGDGAFPKLLAAQHGLPPPELAALIADSATTFQDGPNRDDIAVVVLRDAG